MVLSVGCSSPPSGNNSLDGGVDGGSLGTPKPEAQGALSTKAAGSLPTTMALGALVPKTGVAQWRPAPGGNGGILTAVVEEDASASPRRTVEIALFDDSGALTAGESFNGEAKTGVVAIRRARVEVVQGAQAWGPDGDGTAKVTAFDGTHVSLEINMGLYLNGATSTDVFILEGSVTLSVQTLLATATGNGTFTFSSVQNEPISNDAPTVISTPALSSSTVFFGDKSYPYLGDRPTVEVSDTTGGTTRTLRIFFPSGQLPLVTSYALNKFDRVRVQYFEGTVPTEADPQELWEADQGTFVVDLRSATQLALKLEGARLQSESPSAKGTFNLDGTVTVALP